MKYFEYHYSCVDYLKREVELEVYKIRIPSVFYNGIRFWHRRIRAVVLKRVVEWMRNNGVLVRHTIYDRRPVLKRSVELVPVDLTSVQRMLNNWYMLHGSYPEAILMGEKEFFGMQAMFNSSIRSANGFVPNHGRFEVDFFQFMGVAIRRVPDLTGIYMLPKM